MKWIISLIVLLAAAFPGHGSAIAAAEVLHVTASNHPVPLVADVAEVEPDWTIDDALPTQWASIDDDIALQYDGKTLKFLLRSRFVPDDSMAQAPLYIYFAQTRYVCRGYLNGCLFLQRGDDSEAYNSNLFGSTSHMLPATLLRAGQENELIIEIVTFNGNRTMMPEMYLGTTKEASHFVLMRNLVNVYIPFALFIVGVLNSIFFILVFMSSRKRYRSLHFAMFALMSLSFALTYIDCAFTSNYAPMGALLKTTSVAMLISLQLSTVFILEYYKILERWSKFHAAFLMAVFGISIGYIVWACLADAYEVANTFNHYTSQIALPLLAINIVCIVWNTIRRPIIQNFSLLLANVVVAASIAKDKFDDSTIADMMLTPAGMLLMIFVLQTLFIVDFERILTRLQASRLELKKQNEHMERTIEAQTRALRAHNAKLSETADTLRDINTMKNRFFFIMAHDIKNPLGAIIGFSDMLIKNANDFTIEDKREFIKQINTGAYGLYKMLENLLEWSRLQAGTIKYDPTWFEARRIGEALDPIVSSAAAVKNITLELGKDSKKKVYADFNMTVTICRNLITNAIKFSFPGSEVRLDIDDSNPSDTILTVTDHGLGMTPGQVDNLFKMDKVRSTPGTNHETGSGIGLILCHEFVLAQHGTIKVESEPNKGSRFIVSLPKESI